LTESEIGGGGRSRYPSLEGRRGSLDHSFSVGGKGKEKGSYSHYYLIFKKKRREKKTGFGEGKGE